VMPTRSSPRRTAGYGGQRAAIRSPQGVQRPNQCAHHGTHLRRKPVEEALGEGIRTVTQVVERADGALHEYTARRVWLAASLVPICNRSGAPVVLHSGPGNPRFGSSRRRNTGVALRSGLLTGRTEHGNLVNLVGILSTVVRNTHCPRCPGRCRSIRGGRIRRKRFLYENRSSGRMQHENGVLAPLTAAYGRRYRE